MIKTLAIGMYVWWWHKVGNSVAEAQNAVLHDYFYCKGSPGATADLVNDAIQAIASTEDFVDNTAVNIKTTEGQRCQCIGI